MKILVTHFEIILNRVREDVRRHSNLMTGRGRLVVGNGGKMHSLDDTRLPLRDNLRNDDRAVEIADCDN